MDKKIFTILHWFFAELALCNLTLLLDASFSKLKWSVLLEASFSKLKLSVLLEASFRKLKFECYIVILRNVE